MSTPATLKQMEIAREKAARRNRQNDCGLAPLSAWSPRYGLIRITGKLLWTYEGVYFEPRMGLIVGGLRKRSFLDAVGLYLQVYRISKNIDFTVDRASGRQYTSFEGSRKESEPRAPPKPLTPPPVEDVPIDVDTDDYKVDADKVVCFNGRQNFLSNLYPVMLTVEGHEYPSVEHYYQACKLYTLGGAQLAAQIRRISDAGQVKVFAKRLLRKAGVSPEKIEEWKRTQGPVLLHHAIVHKFVQNADLREKLLETGEAILAHTYDRDNVFATGCDREKMMEWAKNNNGQIIKIPTKIDNDTLVYIPLIGEGKNVLGFINMKVRGQVRHFQATKPNITDPIMLVAMQTLQLNGSSKTEGEK